nr:MAG TPA: hypothetical protein [Caudoviricetes sp.]
MRLHRQARYSQCRRRRFVLRCGRAETQAQPACRRSQINSTFYSLKRILANNFLKIAL